MRSDEGGEGRRMGRVGGWGGSEGGELETVLRRFSAPGFVVVTSTGYEERSENPPSLTTHPREPGPQGLSLDSFSAVNRCRLPEHPIHEPR